MFALSQRSMVVAAMTLLGCPVWATAQQNFPRPIVLYRPPATTSARAATTSRSPNVSQATTNRSQSTGGVGSLQITGPRTITTGTAPLAGMAPGSNSAVQQGQTSGVQATGAVAPTGQGTSTTSETQSEAAKEWAAQESQPTNQVIQNPSGLHNMSHTGISTGQQNAPNLYFGSQFQTWTNQQSRTDSPASYGEMSRFQVGPFGGYVAPNTYMGTGFNNWNNLSSGNASPSPNGGWTYSTWP